MTRKGHRNPLEDTRNTAYYIWTRNFVPAVRNVPPEVRISVLQMRAKYDIIIKGQKRSQLPFVSSITDNSCELLLLSNEDKTQSMFISKANSKLSHPTNFQLYFHYE